MNMVERILELKPEVKVEYRSRIFTLVTASVVAPEEVAPQYRKSIYTEGVSRRSYKDKPNQEVGDAIAKGRALRSLAEKVFNKRSPRNNFMG